MLGHSNTPPLLFEGRSWCVPSVLQLFSLTTQCYIFSGSLKSLPPVVLTKKFLSGFGHVTWTCFTGVVTRPELMWSEVPWCTWCISWIKEFAAPSPWPLPLGEVRWGTESLRNCWNCCGIYIKGLRPCRRPLGERGSWHIRHFRNLEENYMGTSQNTRYGSRRQSYTRSIPPNPYFDPYPWSIPQIHTPFSLKKDWCWP